jgi:hypothetical protein
MTFYPALNGQPIMMQSLTKKDENGYFYGSKSFLGASALRKLNQALRD